MLLNDTLRRAWRRVTTLRRPIILWNLLIWAFSLLILAPISSAVLGAGVFRSGDAIVGNTDLIAFALSPAGIAYIVIAGALAVSFAVMRFTGVFRILIDHADGHRSTLFRTALAVAGRSSRVGRLCLLVSTAAIVVAVPLLLGLWGIHSLFLAEHDINYYLTARPNEWSYALTAGGAWTAAWAIAVLLPAARSILVLPEYLDGYRSIRKSIVRSWRLTRRRSYRVARLILQAIVLWLALRFLVDAVFLWLSSQVLGAIAGLTESIRLLAFAGGMSVLLGVAIDTALSILGFSFVSTVLVSIYLDETELHERAPHLRAVGSAVVDTVRSVRRWLRPAPVALFVAGVVIAGVASGAAFVGPLPNVDSILISAHRAGPPPAPENTLSALESAIGAGADMTEIDVQLTADEVPIIVHDIDFMRVAGDPRRVAAVSYDDVSDLVQRPDDGTPAGERRIATLGDFLERSRDRIDLMIELKYYGFEPELAEVVVQEIREAEMEDQSVVMSLSLPAIRQMRLIAPDIRLGYVSALAIGDLSLLPVDFIAVARRSITPVLLRRADAQGIEVHGWTVNSAAEMAELIDLGVDGLITDDPALAVSVREEVAAMSVAERILMRLGLWVADESAFETDPTEARNELP